jgi:glycosyltransferase involved in cell wall biosynthesis
MKISIVTPSFNQDRFIARTIDSVLSQEGDFELEYIIIDGGSTDGSVEIIREKGLGPRVANSSRVRYDWVSERDEGQADAINKGLRRATGDVVAYLNSDDTYEPGALQRVADFFRARPDAHFVTGLCRIIDEDDREIRQWITRYKNFCLKGVSFRRLLTENPISQPATFWRRDLHDEIGYFDKTQHIVMDYDMWCRIASRHRIWLIPEYLAAFRWYQTSKSGDLFVRQFNDQYKVACRYVGPWNPLRWIHWFNIRKIILSYRVMRLLGGLSRKPSKEG